MIFTELPLSGAYLIEMERFADERGFFARSYCAEVFTKRGLGPELRQCSVSYNARRATLRGMHYQAAPHEEHKLVRCTAGAIFDVIVDIRSLVAHVPPLVRRGVDGGESPVAVHSARDLRMDS